MMTRYGLLILMLSVVVLWPRASAAQSSGALPQSPGDTARAVKAAACSEEVPLGVVIPFGDGFMEHQGEGSSTFHYEATLSSAAMEFINLELTDGEWTMAEPQRLVLDRTLSNERVEFSFDLLAAQLGTVRASDVMVIDGEITEERTCDFEVVPHADLSATKVVSTQEMRVGETLTYTIEVTNAGPNSASDVEVADPLPNGLEVEEVTLTPGDAAQDCTVTGQTVTCGLPQLDMGETATMQVQAIATAGGTLENQAAVTAASPQDFVPDNNASDAVTTTVEAEVSRANVPTAGSGSDPVSTFTGELYFAETPDLSLGGPLPVRFQRYYASFLGRDGRLQSALGPNWAHTFAWRLIQQSATRLEVVTSAGRVLRFKDDGDDWQQTTLSERPYQLVVDGSTFILGNPRTQGIYSFDTDGRLTQIEDGRGNVLTLSYDLDDRLEAVSDGLGRTLTFTYSGDRLASVSDGTRTVQFGYADGLLASATDPLGNATAYSYDTAHPIGGLLTAKTHPDGNARFTQTYDAEGRVATQTDALGNVTTFAYSVDEATGERTTTATDPLGSSFTHVHSSTGRLLSHTDKAGQTIQYAYDAVGQRNRLIDRLGGTTQFDIDPASGLPTAITEANGAQTQFIYTPSTNSAGITHYNRTATDLPDGGSITTSYDSDGNPTSITDPTGGTWSVTYDGPGQPLTVTNPEGGTTTYTYNADGTRASREDPAGNTTTYAYDGLRRLTSITWPGGATRTLSYDDADRITGVTDEEGRTYAYVYEADGTLCEITDPNGQSIQLAYDAMDRLVSVTDRLGNTISRSYDALGRLETVIDRTGNTTTFAYDALDRLTSVTDGEGQTWQVSYDAEGVPTALINPEGETTSFSSNAMGWPVQMTSPLGNATNLTYDPVGCVTAAQDPSGGITMFSRDARGLLDGTTLPGGAAASYVRDGLGLIEGRTGPGGGSWQTPRDVLGHITERIDPLGQSATLAYDNRNRIASVAQPGGLGTVTHTYDGTNRLTGQSHSGGPSLSYSYDGAGRLTGATGVTLGRDAEDRLTESNGLAITRDAEGRIASVALPGGMVEYRYDGTGRLAEVEDWQSGIMAFSYDGAGRLVQMTRPNGTVTTYTYDGGGRLTGIEEADGEGTTLASSTLTRDARGNVTRAERTGPLAPALAPETESYTYDAAGQIEGFSYDALGRLIDDGSRTFVWDGLSRLTSYSNGSETTNFTYDAFGHRLTREGGGTTRQYVWNYALGLPSVAVEKEEGTDRRYYVHTPGGRLLYSVNATDGRRRYYHYDEVGNTLMLTDESGEAAAAYAYSPYGSVVAEQGAVENPFTWQGQFGAMTEGDGLYYLRARYYDARARRFLSRARAQSLRPDEINPYPYARGNPRRFVNPTGLLNRETAPPDAETFAARGEETEFSIVVNGREFSGPAAELLLIAALTGQADLIDQADQVVEGKPFIAGGVPVMLSQDGTFVALGRATLNGSDRRAVDDMTRPLRGVQLPPAVQRTIDNIGIFDNVGRNRGDESDEGEPQQVFRESPAQEGDALLERFLLLFTGQLIEEDGNGMTKIRPPQSNRETRAKNSEDCRVLDFMDYGALVRC